MLRIAAELDNAGLAHGKVEWFAAPRRLALKVASLAAAQADREVEKRGPAIAQAFDAVGGASRKLPTKLAGRAAAVSPSIRPNV